MCCTAKRRVFCCERIRGIQGVLAGHGVASVYVVYVVPGRLCARRQCGERLLYTWYTWTNCCVPCREPPCAATVCCTAKRRVVCGERIRGIQGVLAGHGVSSVYGVYLVYLVYLV